MTDEPPEEQNDVQEGAPATAMMSGAEAIFVRLTFWQTVLGVAGVLIAILALYAALTESAGVRQQTAAAVWPFVQFAIDDYDAGDSASFRMSFTNAGVDPARMHKRRMIINGEPVHDWAHAVKQLGGNPFAPVGRSFLSHRVIRPDETIEMINTMDPDLARLFQAAIADPDNSISYCYCSIFDDCWLADSQMDLQRPEPVEECPDFGNEAYQD